MFLKHKNSNAGLKSPVEPSLTLGIFVTFSLLFAVESHEVFYLGTNHELQAVEDPVR